MKSSIGARVSAIVEKGFCFKASTDQAIDYGLTQSFEYKLKFNPKKEHTWIDKFKNNSDFPMAYIIKTTHPDLYITPNTFILKPHTSCILAFSRMVQEQVLTDEDKIFIDEVCLPKGTSVKDITSIFRFKGKDYIVRKPKVCPNNDGIKVTGFERELGTVTIVRSLFDYN